LEFIRLAKDGNKYLEVEQHALHLVHIHFGMLIMIIKLILVTSKLLEDGKNQV
jgi:uncharacterized membrane protein affecting hemolysin expression